MKHSTGLAVALLPLVVAMSVAEPKAENETMKILYDIEVKRVTGEAVRLEHYTMS